jgi:FMN reductase
VTGPVRSALVVGNPRPASRTLSAGRHVVHGLTGAAPELEVELAGLGPALLEWSDPQVAALVEQVAAAELVVVATPTYKAAYTGLLKLFLDRFGAGSVTGTVVPLMLIGSPVHALAPELVLRPVLSEISTGPVLKGLAVLDSAHDDPAAYDDWLRAVRPTTDRLLTTGVTA